MEIDSLHLREDFRIDELLVIVLYILISSSTFLPWVTTEIQRIYGIETIGIFTIPLTIVLILSYLVLDDEIFYSFSAVVSMFILSLLVVIMGSPESVVEGSIVTNTTFSFGIYISLIFSVLTFFYSVYNLVESVFSSNNISFSSTKKR